MGLVLVTVYVTLVSVLFHVIVTVVKLLKLCVRLEGAAGGSVETVENINTYNKPM